MGAPVAGTLQVKGGAHAPLRERAGHIAGTFQNEAVVTVGGVGVPLGQRVGDEHGQVEVVRGTEPPALARRGSLAVLPGAGATPAGNIRGSLSPTPVRLRCDRPVPARPEFPFVGMGDGRWDARLDPGVPGPAAG